MGDLGCAPVPTRDRVKHAIVHFEVTVDSFRSVLGATGDVGNSIIVDSRSGAVIVDASRQQLIGKPIGGGRHMALPAGGSGWADHDGKRLAFHPVASRRATRTVGS